MNEHFQHSSERGFLRWTTWLKLGLLAFLTMWALVFRLGRGRTSSFVAQRPGSLPLAPALGSGSGRRILFLRWMVGRQQDYRRSPRPGRTLPRALLLGMLAVTTVYVVVSGVFLYLVPLDKVTSDQTFVAQAGEVLFGLTGGVIFAAIVIVCLVGSLAALIISAPRVYYAMAKDGLFLQCGGENSSALRHSCERDHDPGSDCVLAGVAGHLRTNHFLCRCLWRCFSSGLRSPDCSCFVPGSGRRNRWC